MQIDPQGPGYIFRCAHIRTLFASCNINNAKQGVMMCFNKHVDGDIISCVALPKQYHLRGSGASEQPGQGRDGVAEVVQSSWVVP